MALEQITVEEINEYGLRLDTSGTAEFSRFVPYVETPDKRYFYCTSLEDSALASVNEGIEKLNNARQSSDVEHRYISGVVPAHIIARATLKEEQKLFGVWVEVNRNLRYVDIQAIDFKDYLKSGIKPRTS